MVKRNFHRIWIAMKKNDGMKPGPVSITCVGTLQRMLAADRGTNRDCDCLVYVDQWPVPEISRGPLIGVDWNCMQTHVIV